MSRVYEQNNTVWVMLPNRLNNDTAPILDSELFAFLGDHEDLQKIVFDGSEMEYISSAGIRLLLKTRKKITDFRMIHVCEAAYEAISITGMEDLFGLEQEVASNQDTDANTATADSQPSDAGHEHRTRAASTVDIELTGINDTTVNEEFVPVTLQFERQVQLHPKKVACVSTDRKLTYEQLNRAANRVAHQLIEQGIGTEDVVCIMLPRSLYQYIATLGVMKAGAAYVVLNTEYPDDRISFICKDAGFKQIITTREVVYDRLELFVDELQKRPVFLEDAMNHKDATNPGIKIQPGDLCYCIYTSGSTGRPKGVMIEHGNLSNFLVDDDRNLEFAVQRDYSQVFLAMAEMTFDVSVMEEYVSLVCGHTVAFAGTEEIMNPDKMLQFMEEHQVDGMSCTPSYLAGLLRLPKAQQVLSHMKVFDIGAEAFPATLYSAIRKCNQDCKIINGYGPTETTISCTMKLMDGAENVTIGRPNANTYVFVVDESGRELPRGETGELLICGKCVGRGYVGLKEKTEENFISFHGLYGYRSGDLVRINENDEIEYLGRKDFQVKLRGLRIELGEIESVMSSMPGITHCVAAAIDNRYLCLYYVADHDLTNEEIKAFAATKLTEYMVPDLCMRLSEMPMTANMKADRKALPKPVIEEKEIIPPQSDVQKRLTELVSSVMEDVRIGVNTNLLEIGMSSLDIMLLLSLIGDEYRIGIKVADIYEYNDILKLEKYIMSTPKLKTGESKDRYLASTLQTSDYYTNLFENDDINIPTLYELDSSIDLERLRDAVCIAIKAHPGLTMRMSADEEGTVWQIPCKLSDDFTVPIIQMDDDTFDTEKYHLSHPIMCSDLQLFRIEIIDTGSRHFLFTDFSHAISDGESISLFVDDIATAYMGNEVENETYTMFEHGEFLKTFWDTPAGKRGIDLYLERLRVCHGPSTIPSDVEPVSDTVIPGRTTFEMDATYATMVEYCKQKKVSENALLAGLLGLAVSKACGRPDAAFAFAYNGRNDFRLNHTFGFVAAMMMPTYQYTKFSSFEAYVQDVQKQIVNLMIFPEMPLGQIMGAYPNALDVTYIFQPSESDDFKISETVAKGEFLKQNETRTACKTVFQATVHEGRLVWVVDYFANLYSQECINHILEDMNEIFNHSMQEDDCITKIVH